MTPMKKFKLTLATAMALTIVSSSLASTIMMSPASADGGYQTGSLTQDADQAASMAGAGNRWLSSARPKVRRQFEMEFPNRSLPELFDRIIGTTEWITARTTNRLSLSLENRDGPELARLVLSLAKDRIPDTPTARRHAKKFAALFAAGIGTRVDLRDAEFLSVVRDVPTIGRKRPYVLYARGR